MQLIARYSMHNQYGHFLAWNYLILKTVEIADSTTVLYGRKQLKMVLDSRLISVIFDQNKQLGLTTLHSGKELDLFSNRTFFKSVCQ
jgi:hypothetical protein